MRRRTMLLVSVMAGALLLATVAGVAWAAGTIGCDFLGDRDPDQGECAGTRKNDLISGSGFKDIIYAKAGNDQVNAEGGDDEVHGGGGSDEDLDGGDDDDTMYGEGGNDDLDGQLDHDELYGGKGNDRLADTLGGPSPGNLGDVDMLVGGPGLDTFITTDGDGFDIICDNTFGEDTAKDTGDRINPAECP